MASTKKTAAKKAEATKPEKVKEVAKPAKAEKKGGNDLEKKSAQLETLKDSAKAARSAFQSFTKKNNLSMKEAPADKKLKAEWGKLKTAYSELREERDGIEAEVKALTPKKERVVKYDYPADCTSENDRKKFRAQARAAAKKEDKPAKSEKKASKKGKVEEAPAKKSSKKDKKKKAKKEKSED
jgi:hypothetical protein